MALTPQDIAATTFKTVKRNGYDPDQVDDFKRGAASALEAALHQATAMEARARAAVAKVQELSQQVAPVAEPTARSETGPAAEAREVPPSPDVAETPPREAETPSSQPVVATVAESDTISRTLLLAQRTADTTIAEAEREAEASRRDAATQAEAIVEAARVDSRKAGEAERVRVEGEVQALLARRDFLESDVEHLEQHIEAQRERVTEVVAELESITDRVPNGLAAMRRPQLSASDHSSVAEPAEPGAADLDDDLDVATLIDEVAAADDGADELSEISRVASEPDDADAPDVDRGGEIDAGEPPHGEGSLFGPA